MGDVTCPMCGHALTDPSAIRGVLINRDASLGARIAELEAQLSRVPRSAAVVRAALERQIEERRGELAGVRREVAGG